jgi:DNA-binding response OmpR family regulator
MGKDDRTNPESTARRALVVEDQHDTAVSFALLLAEMGLKVEYLTDARRALDVTKTFKPEIVFLDIGLPFIDGYTLAGMLRKEVGAKVPIVAITGYGADQDRKRSREAGFDAHILKPVDMALLDSILKQF